MNPRTIESIQKYLKNGGLPSGGESEYYMRAKIVEEISASLVMVSGWS